MRAQAKEIPIPSPSQADTNLHGPLIVRGLIEAAPPAKPKPVSPHPMKANTARILRFLRLTTLALAALGISQPPAHANGTPYHFDVNGATAGFGTPTGTYALCSNPVWSADAAGTSNTMPVISTHVPGVQWTFGAPGLDFAGSPIRIHHQRERRK